MISNYDQNTARLARSVEHKTLNLGFEPHIGQLFLLFAVLKLIGIYQNNVRSGIRTHALI